MTNDSPVSRSAGAGGDFAAALRGFGPLGLLAIAAILAGNFLFPPLSALLALGWVKLSRTPWRDIGYVRPRSWLGGLVLGLIFGVVFKLAMKAVIMPLLEADPVNHAYHYVTGDPAALPGMFYAVVIGAGFGEETLYRGYMFERLGRLLETRPAAKAAAVLITSAVFALAHFTVQGWTGVEQAAVTGLVFGTIFAMTGRIWMLMCAHAAFDLTALGLIYWGLETQAAHLVFR